MKNRLRNRRGVTLLELLVLVALFTLMSGLALPSMRTAILNARVRWAADRLEEGLRQARMMAISRNQPVVFCVTTGSAARLRIVTNIGSATTPCATAPSAGGILQLADEQLAQEITVAAGSPSYFTLESGSTYRLHFGERGLVTLPSAITAATAPTLTVSAPGGGSTNRTVSVVTILGKVTNQ
jgi:Tfp pilus assembly protein FimT